MNSCVCCGRELPTESGFMICRKCMQIDGRGRLNELAYYW